MICFASLKKKNTTGLPDELHRILQSHTKYLIIDQRHWCESVILMAQLPRDHEGNDIEYIISETSGWAYFTAAYSSSDWQLAGRRSKSISHLCSFFIFCDRIMKKSFWIIYFFAAVQWIKITCSMLNNSDVTQSDSSKKKATFPIPWLQVPKIAVHFVRL